MKPESDGTRGPGRGVVLDSGSHINARGQRPEREHRERPVRCTAELDLPTAFPRGGYDLRSSALGNSKGYVKRDVFTLIADEAGVGDSVVGLDDCGTCAVRPLDLLTFAREIPPCFAGASLRRTKALIHSVDVDPDLAV